jgi:hypothetical protein
MSIRIIPRDLKNALQQKGWSVKAGKLQGYPNYLAYTFCYAQGALPYQFAIGVDADDVQSTRELMYLLTIALLENLAFNPYKEEDVEELAEEFEFYMEDNGIENINAYSVARKCLDAKYIVADVLVKYTRQKPMK